MEQKVLVKKGVACYSVCVGNWETTVFNKLLVSLSQFIEQQRKHVNGILRRISTGGHGCVYFKW